MNSDAPLDQAFDAYNARRFDEAEHLVRAVLALSPQHGDALYLLGLIAVQSGALSIAEDALYQAVQLYPDIAAYRCALAMTLHKQGRLDEALEHYRRYASDLAVLAQMGLIYLNKNQESTARACFDKALSFDKAHPESLIGLAQIHIMRRRWKMAEQTLHRIATDTPDKWYYLGHLYRRTKRFAAARRALDKALAAPHESYWIERGRTEWEDGKTDAALVCFQNAVRLNPYAAAAYYYAGRVQADGGRLDEAVDSYRQALKRDDDFLEAHHYLAEALCRSGRAPEGLEHYHRALLLNPRYVPSLFQLAALLENIGEFEEAAGLYFNVLSLKARVPRLSVRLAKTLEGLAKTDLKLARKLAKGWVKNFPADKRAICLNNQLKK
ncbi:MAG: tetratricopeptide repeat protein [Alphaproteobacteria bacterium]|nr:tetratricopeptide repeat protein [Alphaproteobacteria bacterium]